MEPKSSRIWWSLFSTVEGFSSKIRTLPQVHHVRNFLGLVCGSLSFSRRIQKASPWPNLTPPKCLWDVIVESWSAADPMEISCCAFSRLTVIDVFWSPVYLAWNKEYLIPWLYGVKWSRSQRISRTPVPHCSEVPTCRVLLCFLWNDKPTKQGPTKRKEDYHDVLG